MSDTGNIDRLKLYKDQNTQFFLNKFISGEISELEPVYNCKLGYHYPSVEAIVGNASEAETFLNRLYEAGILERKLYDKVIYCPKCGSANVSIRYCCPYCKSFDISKSALIEHVKCGYMDVEDNFRKGKKLVCPKCNEELKKPDVDYRKAGVWCNCKECGKSFDIPVATHFCREKSTTFTFEDAIIKDVYVYRLKEEAKKEFFEDLGLVVPIQEVLTKKGFTVEMRGSIKGRSGASHTFDVIVYRSGKRKPIVIDLAKSTDDTVSEQPIIALFAKIFDVSPLASYLIAIPKLSENGKRMAKLYKIGIVEAEDQDKAALKLGNILTG